MDNIEIQKQNAFSVAKSVSPEVLQEIRSLINHALETGASYQEAKKEIDQFLARHQSFQGQEVTS